MDYDVMYASKVVGQAQTKIEGLYCRITACCQMEKQGIYKLQILNENKVVKTLTCIPGKEGYTAETRIPAKQLETGEVHFVLMEKSQISQHQAVVNPQQEFPYMAQLEQAVLVSADDQPVIAIREAPTQDLQDSDQSPEPDDKSVYSE